MAEKKKPTSKKTSTTKQASAKKKTAAKATSKAATKKQGARKQTGANRQGLSASRSPITVTAEERWRMIAEVAYQRAERRGFEHGDPVDDWLAAERQVDDLLRGKNSGRR